MEYRKKRREFALLRLSVIFCVNALSDIMSQRDRFAWSSYLLLMKNNNNNNENTKKAKDTTNVEGKKKNAKLYTETPKNKINKIS